MRAYLGRDVVGPVRRRATALRERYEIGDRRVVRLAPDPVVTPIQLSLADAIPASAGW